MKGILSTFAIGCLLMTSSVSAQSTAEPFQTGKRYSVIIDNDFMGDPDGLFQLAHHALSSSCDINLLLCKR